MKKGPRPHKSKTNKTAKSSKNTLPEPLAGIIDILAKQTAEEHHEMIYGVRVDPYLQARYRMKGIT